MANQIILKRSSTPGKVPTTSQLALGEIGINTNDGLIYIKKDDGTASVVQIGGITSVNTKTGAVTLTTTDIAEGTAQYFTNARARSAVNGGTGITYSSTTGAIAVDTTTIATRIYVDDAVTALVASAPATLNTLNELAAALNSDADFSTTVSTNIGLKLSKASNLSDLASAPTARTNLGLATVAATGSYADLINKPSNANVGTFGSATAIPVITVDNGGNVTAVTTTAVSIPSGALTFTGDVTGTGTTGSSTALSIAAGSVSNAKLANSSVTIGSTAVSLGSTASTLAGLTLTSPVINSATVGGHLIPTVDLTYDLGDATKRFRNLYLSGSSISISGTSSGTLTITAPAVAGTTTVTFPATTGTVVTTGDTGSITNTMLAGSIANAKLQNSSTTIGTTAIVLGASSTTLAGLTSVASTSFVGALTGNASTVTNGVYTTDTGSVTNTMLAGSIANAKLSNSAVTVTAGTGMSGGGSVSLGGTITLTNTITQYTDALARASVSGSTGISYNSTTGAISSTITQYTDALAVSANTSAIATAKSEAISTASADATSKANAAQAAAIAAVTNGAGAAFDTLKEIQDAMATDAELSAAIAALTIGNGVQTITAGTYLTGGGTFSANQTGASSVTLTVDATSANTASKVVARDASGNFTAGTITAALTGNTSGTHTGAVVGNASTATTAGTVTTAAQTAITSVGTLTGLTVSGATATGALTVTGGITASGEITAYFSDERLKKDIAPIQGALDKVMAIGGYTYKANDLAHELGVSRYDNQIGLLAGEVEAVMPELVTQSGLAGYKTIRYDKVVSVLVEAIKEQQAMIEELRKDVKTLS